MTVYTSGGRLHLWRECLPMRSHYAIKAVEVVQLSSFEMRDVCKRCRLRLSLEGWPK